MTIIFNPFYSERPFLGDNAFLNKTIVGTSGLLAELELRAGLTAVYPTKTERIVAYITAMQHAVSHNTNGKLFFEESFSLDKFGTAEILLGWRDTLVYAGWNKTITGSDKLNGLAAIEHFFESKGEADRWQQVLKYAETNAVLRDSDEIEVTTTKGSLDTTLKKLLDEIAKSGTTITYLHENTEINQVPEYATHRHFHTDIEAHTWMVQQQLSENDVIAGFDNTVLADMAYTLNRPAEASSENGIGAQMQMLYLGISLFNKTIDAQRLLNYLRLPKSPLRSVYHEKTANDGHTYLKPLSEELKDILLDGGLGEEWENTLNSKPFVDFHHENKERNRNEILSFINMWDKSFISGEQCMVNRNDVQNYISALRKWAARQQVIDATLHMQFSALVAACDEMLLLLDSQPETINTTDLQQWAKQITRPACVSVYEAIAGSPDTIDSPACIYANPDNIYWLCSTDEQTTDPYDFLGADDKQILTGTGIELPEKGTNALLLQNEIQRNLGKAKNIHLVSCDLRHGNTATENSIALKMMQDKTEYADIKIDTEEKSVTGLSKNALQYQIDSTIIKEKLKLNNGHFRPKESYSSLNMLIQTPFEYVLQYILNMRSYQSDALSDINTIKGIVAHRYIEWLTNVNDNNSGRMRQMHGNGYDENINRIIETHGILLMQENNRLDMMQLKNQLRNSVNVLLEIITTNHLTIIGPEHKAETEIEGIGKMEAIADYLLETPDGKLVIFDFKWNEGNTYKTKLENNLALQLAVYKNIIGKARNQEVVFCGYYLLPKQKLLTHNTGVLSHANIEIIQPANNNDIFMQAVNSYNYRKRQLEDGIIEEAETLPLADLQYEQDAAEYNLYPLEKDYYNNQLKATSYGEPNKVLKGRLI